MCKLIVINTDQRPLKSNMTYAFKDVHLNNRQARLFYVDSNIELNPSQ